MGAVGRGCGCCVSVLAAWTVDQHPALSTEVPRRKGQPCHEGRVGRVWTQKSIVG